jgi:hypothetical protein
LSRDSWYPMSAKSNVSCNGQRWPAYIPLFLRVFYAVNPYPVSHTVVYIYVRTRKHQSVANERTNQRTGIPSPCGPPRGGFFLNLRMCVKVCRTCNLWALAVYVLYSSGVLELIEYHYHLLGFRSRAITVSDEELLSHWNRAVARHAKVDGWYHWRVRKTLAWTEDGGTTNDLWTIIVHDTHVALVGRGCSVCSVDSWQMLNESFGESGRDLVVSRESWSFSFLSFIPCYIYRKVCYVRWLPDSFTVLRRLGRYSKPLGRPLSVSILETREGSIL